MTTVFDINVYSIGENIEINEEFALVPEVDIPAGTSLGFTFPSAAGAPDQSVSFTLSQAASAGQPVIVDAASGEIRPYGKQGIDAAWTMVEIASLNVELVELIEPVVGNAGVAGAPVANSAGFADMPEALSVAPEDARVEIVFLDATASNFQQLLDGIDPAFEVHVVHPGVDGVEFMASVLEGRSGIDAVHVISHGDDGEFRLGTSHVDQASIQGEYSNALSSIGNALSANADFLVYGCNFGTDAGAVSALAAAVGADVAASNDLTGHVNQGADWDLEVQTGSIEAGVPITAQLQQEWQGVLGNFSLNWNSVVWNNGDLSRTYTLTSSTGQLVDITIQVAEVINSPVPFTGNGLLFPREDPAAGGIFGNVNDLAVATDPLNTGTATMSITVTFTRGGSGFGGQRVSVDDVNFLVTDLDWRQDAANNSRDQVTVNTAGTVNLSVVNTTSPTVSVLGNVATASVLGVNSNNDDLGSVNVNVTGGTSQITLLYDDFIGSGNPSGRGIGLFGGFNFQAVNQPDTGTTAEDTVLNVNAANGVLSNDDNTSGTLAVQTFTIAGVTGSFNAGQTASIPGVGTLLLRANGSYVFTPAANYNGAVPTVTYTTIDGTATETSTLNITVTPVNDAPVDGNEANTVIEDTTLSVAVASPANLLANTTDIDGGTPIITGYTVPGLTGTQAVGTPVTIPGVGSITINANGSYSFTPAANYTGAIPVITYTVSDQAGGTDTSTLTLTMSPQPDPAVIGGDVTGAVTEDDAATLTATGALTISDPDAGEAVFNAGTVNGTYGDLTIDAGGNWSYAADNSQSVIQSLAVGATLTETVTVTSADGTTQDITITINGVNDGPVATDNAGSVTEDSNLSDTGNMLTDNDGDGVDSDIDIGDSLVVTSVEGVAAATGSVAGTYGSLSFDGTGAYTYDLTNADPAVQALGVGETLIETFDYVVSDGNGGSDTATLTITINGQNDAPTGFAQGGPDVYFDILESCSTIFSGHMAISVGSTVAVLGDVTDVDTNDNHTFTLVDNLGTPVVDPNFEILGNELVLKAGNSLAVGVVTPLQINVQVDDGNGGTIIQAIDLNVSLYSGSYAGAGDRDFAIGTAGNDTISGGSNADFLFGGSGDDVLNGGAGWDILEGGAGADTLNGGGSGDMASYFLSDAGVVADLANSAVNTGDAAGDVYNSIEGLQGSAFADSLSGDNNVNWIMGAAGDDVINGRGGNDFIWGGNGDDEFIHSDGDGDDMIYDFVAGAGTDDVLNISSFGFADFAAVVSASSLNANGHVVIQLDVNDSVTLCGVSSVASLHQDDFVI